MKRKIELEQLEDDLKFWKWKILEWDGMNWVVIKQGIKEGFDNAVYKAKEEYALLKLLWNAVFNLFRVEQRGDILTKKQLEKKYNIKLMREQNPYMGGRLFWSVKDLNNNEIERCETLNDVEEKMSLKF